MIFTHRLNPKTTMSIGMLCLAVGRTLPEFLHGAVELGPNWTHGIGGPLVGFSIVFNIASVRQAARQHRSARYRIT